MTERGVNMDRETLSKQISKRKMYIGCSEDDLIYRYKGENYEDIEKLMDAMLENGVKEGDKVNYYQIMDDGESVKRVGAIIFTGIS
ncbi:MAG: hypothetical protein FXF47_04970 [Candidatus Mcinerneyibacterium aminivorans]|uniref:Uncharacterized protein n=1 Tax=Candidatus Mcinerneyibacterium aminivorans TaxID=2703815 RepID=A0A5D0MC17_9BACT|nr:MAG: hypothetical protein FXF47_04970 [Candidatus Mcinerneyibacterium aminivorans]